MYVQLNAKILKTHSCVFTELEILEHKVLITDQ